MHIICLFGRAMHKTTFLIILGECIALWDEPNELSIQHRGYIFMQYVDS